MKFDASIGIMFGAIATTIAMIVVFAMEQGF